ncbi:MAG: TonB-dependent receptor, partial [Prevotellaceae bacterium]|nr:TonB-dependent receptor [Prevotellaceae bacterium]
KIAYNVEDDPDSKSNTVLDMLRKVPLVTVDGEDNIKVNGSSSFKVYVNGRPNNMMTNNPTEVLKSMPATSIKNIEVITNPGPKYDAEGVGGILNIITVGQGLEGYTVTLTGNGYNRGATGAVSGTVKTGKLMVSGRFNYNYRRGAPSTSDVRRTYDLDPTDTSSLHTQEESGRSTSSGDGKMGSLEASYDIDTLRMVSLSVNVWGDAFNSDNTTRTVALPAPQASSNALYSYDGNSRQHQSYYAVEGGVDYQRLSPTVKERMFTFSYKINTEPYSTNSYSTYDNIAYQPAWGDYIRRLQDQHTRSHQNTLEQTLQADYTTPLGKLHAVEGGVKFISRNNTAENDRFLRAAGSGDYTFDTNRSTHYKHLNSILAAYAGYTLKLNHLSARLGVRYEHTFQSVKYLLGPGANFRKDFDDVVPSASLGWELAESSNLRLSYNMRIYRPDIWYLNPYIDDSNPSEVSQGNPNLSSERRHAFNLSYSNFTGKLNLNLALRYDFTGNGIEQTTTLRDDGTLYSTYYNIGKAKTTGLSAYINYNATPFTRIYLNLYGEYTDLKAGRSLRANGWNANLSGGAQQSLPHDWRISINGNYQPGWTSLQMKGASFYGYTLSLNKSFLKRRLTLSAYASQLFPANAVRTSSMTGPGFAVNNRYVFNRQRFGASISYRLGELKAGVKKAARSINNDDVKESGGNSGDN